MYAQASRLLFPPAHRGECVSLRYLSSHDVRAALDMPTAIGLMRQAFMALSTGGAVVPVRTTVELEHPGSRALFMPAHAATAGRFGIKVVGVHPDNRAAGLPLVHALMLVFDSGTGEPRGVLDAETLTAIRTGAASGLATDLLARADADVLAIFGTGVQARTQLEAVCAVRPIRRTWVFGRDAERGQAFASEMRARVDCEIAVADSPTRLRETDIVCAATTARQPVFAASDVAAGTHINGIGAYTPAMAEIPAEVVGAARLVVDHRASCLAEAGDIVQPLEAGLIDASHIAAELGEVAAGLKEGRTAADEITLFKSVGNAAQDLFAAAHVIEVAERDGLGTVLG